MNVDFTNMMDSFQASEHKCNELSKANLTLTE